MVVGDFSARDLARRLRRDGVTLHIGPFSVNLRSALPDVISGAHLLYRDYRVSESPFADFHVSVETPAGLRRWLKPQVFFSLDGNRPFKPLPRPQALATLEWGLNWCISAHCHQYLILHAAVAEKNGLAVMFPARPGAGKSTLTAGLVSRGWRLFSDELALLSLDEPGILTPVPRPINLKNESIAVIREFAPQSTMGPVVADTNKGTVAHMRAPVNSIERSSEPARPGFIVFPRFVGGSPTILDPESKARSFMTMAQQSFNFHVLADTAFDALHRTVSSCNCHELTYSNLDEAVYVLDELVADREVAAG